MTQTRSDEAENRTRNPEGSVPEERTTSDSRPFGESSMDRDAGERSAREKLKKASLASLGANEEQISTDYQAEQPNAFAADDLGNLNSRRVSNQEHSSATSSQIQEEKSASHESCESKAQPVTEDRAKPDINEISVTENQHQDLEQLYPVDDEGDVQTRVLSNTSVINDGNMSRNQSSNLFTHGDNEIEGTGGNTNSKLRNHNDTASLSKDANTNVNNSREEEKGTASPRKKRSRDQLDPEIDREQKIAATEEARAQRLSTEADRPDIDTSSQQNLNDDRRSGDARSAFGNTSQVKAAGVAHRLGSPGDDTNRASVSDAFASSGFAVLANSTTSPFGTISSSGSGLTGFASFASIRKLSSDKSNDGGQGLSSAKSNDSDLEPPDKRKDLSTVFGGPVFGQGFSAGGSKLSTFAAPKGDAHLGGDIDTIKPMGSVELQGKDVVEIASDSGDIDNEIGKEESPNDADDRFYTQKVGTGEDGEESQFASRASLFSFRNNVWKESGKGIFKFNVTRMPEAGGSTQMGRFIMRAHQTYRVLLNAPVFQQMKVGDSRGKEPTGKSFAFAVIEEGRPIPHMVKLSDENESKMLYHAVRRIQAELLKT